MTEPTAPSIPADAPQEVKDFFGCTGDRLVWRPGEVTWLGLQVTPSVDFTEDPKSGGLTINVSILMGMVSFGLPATINASGELVVDTSSVPDMSEWNMGGRQDIDAAIKNINDWFKKNGKKLSPHKLQNGAVTLEKVPIAAPATTRTATAPTPAPVRPTPPRAAPAPVSPPSAPPSPGGGCGLLGLFMLVMLIGVIAIGGGLGYVYFGGQGTGVAASATPTAHPASPRQSPTPEPTPANTSSPAPTPTITPTPSASPAPPSTTPSPPPAGQFTAVCIRVVHEQVGDFVSYLDWFVWWTDYNVEYFEITVAGANNGEPQRLEFESRSQAYEGLLGLNQAGDKRIVSVIAHMSDGSQVDLTEDLIDEFGSDEFTVRFPQEDRFGLCPPE